MASASTIPLMHVEASSLQDPLQQHQFPPLGGGGFTSTASNNNNEDWEMVPEGTSNTTQVKFDAHALQKRDNPKILKHSQSSPNLRNYHLDDSEEEDSEEDSAVFVEEESTAGSSSMMMVSDPPSVWSAGGASKLSFKDAILQNGVNGEQPSMDNGNTSKKKQPRKIGKAKFEVVKPKSQMRRTSSMPDLHEGHEVLGDTDAHDYYARKSQGAIGRMNGIKQRPDEAKRLQIIMAKKSMQRERQKQRG